MCGIAGYIEFGPTNFNDTELHAMAQRLHHRGPDAKGFYTEPGVGLAHARLSIIDLSQSANQPMISQNERYVIIFNGEVYNFDELRREYHLQCKTNSDTEVILELFAKIGIEAVECFNGMFSIAIFDKQEKELWLIRDRIGIKPLFYYYDNHSIAFASEINSLLELKYIKDKISINYDSINEFLHLGYIPQPHTIWNGISKFPSGCYARISKDKFDIKSYWDIESIIQPETLTDKTQAREILRDLIVSSVRYRLKSDVPFGCFLSGGIDSSLVTAVAQSQLSRPLNTFSIAFEESKYNEAHHAKRVADYLGTNHHELTVSENDALSLVEEMLESFHEPFSDSSAIPTMLVSKLAKDQVTMTLSGDGGDELFMGYGMYTWADRLHKPLLSKYRKSISTILSLGNNRHKRAAQVFNFNDENTIKSHIFSQEQYLHSRNDIKRAINPTYLRPIYIEEKINNINRHLSYKEQQSIFDIKYYLKDDLLVKVDRASMHYSLEARVPLLDYNIVEFALNLDESLKIQNGVSKYLLKEVLYDFVPAHFFQRPKWGFSIPLEKWLKSDLKYLIDIYLCNDMIKKHSIVNTEYIDNLKKQYFNGKDYLYNRIWQMIVLHKFMNEHS